MHPNFYKNNPFRPPQWRADRVMQMVEHRPSPLRPRSYDDHYVRAYRLFLLSYIAAGNDEEKRYAAILAFPHLYHAHMMHHHPDRQWRQILDAWLLTSESFDKIAERLGTEAKAVIYYEQLFFNVRDRMQHSTWIAKVILGHPEDRAANQSGVMTENQRGFLYRLFGHYGGPLVLDAMVSGMAPKKMPKRVEDIADWFSDALGQIVKSRATAAAAILETNKHNVMHLLKVALGATRAASAARTSAETSPTDVDKYAEKIVAKLDWGLFEQLTPKVDKTCPT